MRNDIYKWWHTATIYEIYPKAFIESKHKGNVIQGIISKLDYLYGLGVDALWLCPIFDSPFIDSGYDIRSYYDVNPDFGTIEDIKMLIKECHNKGMRLILDIALNHTSSEHPWFIEASKDNNSPYRDYYFFRQGKNKGEGAPYPNNWVSSRTMSSMWAKNSFTDDYYFHIYTKQQPDLNWRNKTVRNEVIHILKYWIELGIDGFRLDVINKVAKPEGLPDKIYDRDLLEKYADKMVENLPEVHDYIREMRETIEAEHKDVLWIGQTAGISVQQAYDYTNPDRNELDLCLTFEHTDINKTSECRQVKWTVKQLKAILAKWQNTMNEGLWPTVFFGNHDVARMVSRYVDAKEDEIPICAKLLCTLQLCLGGTQIIYMGDELGLPNASYEDIDDFEDVRSQMIYAKRIEAGESKEEILSELNKLARDHARYPIPWSKHESAINQPNSVYNYYKETIALRKKNDCLTKGITEFIDVEDEALIAYRRYYKGDTFTIVANMTRDKVNTKDMGFEGTVLHGNYETLEYDNFRPYEVKVYYKNSK